MRLIDFLVIYLAVGAPVAALAFLRELSRNKNTARAAFRFFWTLVLWPFFAVLELWSPGKRQEPAGLPGQGRPVMPEVLQTTLGEINQVIRGQDPLLALDDYVLEKAADLKESILKYFALNTAVSSVDRDERAAQHEINFYQASGADARSLKVSADCLHRRNLTRVRTHLERSKRELISSLFAFSSAMTTAGTIDARKNGIMRVTSVACRLLEVVDCLDDRDLAVDVAKFLDSTFRDLAQVETQSIDAVRQAEGAQPKTTATAEVLIGVQR
jgi:hypothetical protein